MSSSLPFGGPVGLPPAERLIPATVAVPFFKVSDSGLQLEGPCFDRAGDLLFVEVFGGQVFRLTDGRTLSTIMPRNDRGAAGLALHRDGRIFVAGLGNFRDTGSVVAIGPDGDDLTVIVAPEAGFLPDDLVFDADGGFYFTDFRGSSTEPLGGVFYVRPEGGAPVPIVRGLAVANGVALSPGGRELWVTESSGCRLHRIEMADATTIGLFGTTIAHYFCGAAPDSMRADADGNLYVAMYGQARVLIFNPAGMPIAQVLLPGREDGHFLRTTSMAIRPETRELYIVANDWDKGRGSMIFRAESLAPALKLFSHT